MIIYSRYQKIVEKIDYKDDLELNSNFFRFMRNEVVYENCLKDQYMIYMAVKWEFIKIPNGDPYVRKSVHKRYGTVVRNLNRLINEQRIL